MCRAAGTRPPTHHVQHLACAELHPQLRAVCGAKLHHAARRAGSAHQLRRIDLDEARAPCVSRTGRPLQAPFQRRVVEIQIARHRIGAVDLGQ